MKLSPKTNDIGVGKKNVSFSVTAAEHRKYKKFSDQSDMSMGEWIRLATADAIREGWTYERVIQTPVKKAAKKRSK